MVVTQKPEHVGAEFLFGFIYFMLPKLKPQNPIFCFIMHLW